MRGKAGKTGGDCARDPRGAFQFIGLPEGPAKLRRVVILMVLVYYHQQRLQIKISTGIRCMEQSPGETGASFQLPSPSGGVGTALYSPSNSVCREVWRIAKQGSSLRPCCPWLLRGSVTQAWRTCVTELTLLAAPLEVRLIQHGPRHPP